MESTASQFPPASVKLISFPAEEIPGLKTKSKIITHRVSDDAVAFSQGDVVATPWGDTFSIVKKDLISSIYESPFVGFLTSGQKQYLSKFSTIAILTLVKIEELDFSQAFAEIVERYHDIFGLDLTYMTFTLDSQPLYANGKPCYEHSSDECGGDWTDLGFIRLNPDMKSVMSKYGIGCNDKSDLVQFTRTIIAHELAHEVWNNIASDSFKFKILSTAMDKHFSSPYLATVRDDKLDEETFCEFLAHVITA